MSKCEARFGTKSGRIPHRKLRRRLPCATGTRSRLRFRPSDRGDDQPVSLPARAIGTKQAKQEEHAGIIEYIRASPWHKRTSGVPGSLQDLATRL